jgi:Zn-finger nucleic acid-binding protein
MMQCVKCSGALVAKEVGAVEIDQCELCSGIWCDLGELRSVLDASFVEELRNHTDNNAGHDGLRAKCPRCGGDGSMVPVLAPGSTEMHIDTCAVCFGVWLDGGELEELVETSPWRRLRRWWHSRSA